jgi:uncharacterized membrane protein
MPHPLHPAVVHFPLVLAVLFPVLAGVALYASRRVGAGRGAWIVLAAAALLLTGSAWVSVETGQNQEDVVERVVSEGIIHGHEEAAEGLLLGSVVVLAVVLAGFLPGRTGAAARYLSVVAGLVAFGLAYRVGASGGALVYEQGAASAYVGAPSTATGSTPEAGRARRGDPDDDDDHR